VAQKSAALVVLLVAAVSTLIAQTDPASGILPFSTQVGGQYDSVDLATGNILIRIPVRSKMGKIPFAFDLVMNSHAYIYQVQGSSTVGISRGMVGQPFCRRSRGYLQRIFDIRHLCGPE